MFGPLLDVLSVAIVDGEWRGAVERGDEAWGRKEGGEKR